MHTRIDFYFAGEPRRSIRSWSTPTLRPNKSRRRPKPARQSVCGYALCTSTTQWPSRLNPRGNSWRRNRWVRVSEARPSTNALYQSTPNCFHLRCTRGKCDGHTTYYGNIILLKVRCRIKVVPIVVDAVLASRELFRPGKQARTHPANLTHHYILAVNVSDGAMP